MPTLDTSWGTYHYRDIGTGPLVVLLHPLAASGAIWQPWMDELSSRYRVIAPDARGHGASEWNGEPFSVPDLAKDAADLIDHLDIGPARVAGLSMGGCTAIALAVRYPEHVARLVLADTTADYGPDKGKGWAERGERAVSVPRDKQLPFQVERWFSPEFAENRPEEVERVSSIFTATDSVGHAAACSALGSYSDVERINEISSPTLIVVGEDDFATPPAFSRTLAAGVPDSTLVVLPSVRHMSLLESVEARGLAEAHFDTE